MALQVEQAVREFKYNGMALADPGAQLSAEEVKAFYANLYPELNNAAIEGPEQLGAKMVYEFRRAVGTKGALKTPVHEYCTRCGEKDAEIRGDVVWFGLHRCAKPVPGPQEPPHALHITRVEFIGPRRERVPQITPGVELIMKERDRQIVEEGWTAQHDDQHGDGSLADAAASYALRPEHRLVDKLSRVPAFWPWSPNWWKPKSRIEDLTRAGALIAAEIDRLLRAQAPKDENDAGEEV